MKEREIGLREPKRTDVSIKNMRLKTHRFWRALAAGHGVLMPEVADAAFYLLYKKLELEGDVSIHALARQMQELEINMPGFRTA